MEFELVLTGFLAASIRIATPLLLAALGELINERAGVINLGLEGAMLAGALAAALGALAGGPWLGAIAGVAAGVAIAGTFSMAALWAGAQQVIAGTAVTLGSVGLTGMVFRNAFGPGGPGLSVPMFEPLPIPALREIPILGPALFEQPGLTYLAWILVPAVGWVLFRSWWGLAVRATGESVEAARAAGVPVQRVRILATLTGGALGGLAGATLVLAQTGTFAEKMTAGRGFIALAIVVLGRWHPLGVLGAALLFGAAGAMQFALQALGLQVPYQGFLALPYGLALLALGGGLGNARAPRELSR
ncbi:MAG: ABC transporter permease [Gemmatimonadales bacterium]